MPAPRLLTPPWGQGLLVTRCNQPSHSVHCPSPSSLPWAACLPAPRPPTPACGPNPAPLARPALLGWGSNPRGWRQCRGPAAPVGSGRSAPAPGGAWAPAAPRSGRAGSWVPKGSAAPGWGCGLCLGRGHRAGTPGKGTAGDMCGATRAPVQQQSCPTEPGGAPSSVLLPAPAPGSAALAGVEMRAVGLGMTRLGPCQQGEGERKFWEMSGRLCPSVPCDELFGLCRHSLWAWPGCLGPVWGDSAGLGGCAGVRLVAQWGGSCLSPARGPRDPWRCPFPCLAPGR